MDLPPPQRNPKNPAVVRDADDDEACAAVRGEVTGSVRGQLGFFRMT